MNFELLVIQLLLLRIQMLTYIITLYAIKLGGW